MKVLVLLSTYNGEKYLEEQLDSIFKQKDVKVDILVRDDGSTDSTHKILNNWQAKGKLKWYTGENLKPAKSFINLIMNAPKAEYYAFCDQDDVWLENKLSVGITALEHQGADLYYSSYTVVDKNLNILEEDRQKPIMKTLGQAAVYASVTGCTMVFTRKLLNFAKMYKPENIMMHDSWLFKIALATECEIVYDNCSHILYRQHGNNAVGDKSGILKKWLGRCKRLINNQHKRHDEIRELYVGYKNIISQKQMLYLLPLVDYYKKTIFKKIIIAFKPIYKTGVVSSDVLFKLAIIFNKF